MPDDPDDDPVAPRDPATNGTAGPLNGHAHPGPSAEAEASAEAAPTAILELAASCVRFVLAKYKVPLDGTPDTLSILDHYVKEARAELEVRPEGLALLAATVGAYFGEVVRGVFDASWHIEGDHDGWRLRLRDAWVTFNPLGMAREALTLDDAPGWHAHVEVDPGDEEEVERRLKLLPEVSPEEYHAPTTRFDVIELAFTAVRARMQAAGLGDVVFSDEDYER